MSEYEKEFKFHLDQVEMAARGMLSGTLKEWPMLYTALDYFGVKVSRRHRALYVRKICELVYDEEKNHDFS